MHAQAVLADHAVVKYQLHVKRYLQWKHVPEARMRDVPYYAVTEVRACARACVMTCVLCCRH